MAIGLSILEQEDALKNLPTQALQGLMGQPSPQVPPFMVAAELKRREEMAKEFKDVLANELDEHSTLLLGAFKKS